LRIGGFQGRRRARHLAGPVRGLPHRAARIVPLANHVADADSTELKHRVESELGRDITLPLHTINIDAVDGVIRVRGVASDTEQARRLVERAARVGGVRGVLSLMHTPDGSPVGGSAGKAEEIAAGPAIVVRARRLHSALIERWPWLSDDDILGCEGHPERFRRRIAEQEHCSEQDVRSELDSILMAAIDPPR
ncbi:MAG TPA: BON domain-containing protein, partial [Dehalococcoidia bacterium]|nr:BON domain-containing protein [Dehalococcoidia bacterium]